jgi:hypothetical protein
MAASSALHVYPTYLRLLSGLAGLGLILGSFSVITALTRPSQFVAAAQNAAQKPGLVADLQKLPVLDFTHHLYLYGPISPANGHAGPLFLPGATPVLAPATFSDASGAVEVLAKSLPQTAEPSGDYQFNEPLHLLGWRTAKNGYTLFALARSQQALQNILRDKSARWHRPLFRQGLWLMAMIFVIFWLLNISLLSTPMLRITQLLFVNLVFLVLYYSVLALSGYDLLSTLPRTLLILVLSNTVFIPLALVFRPKHLDPAKKDVTAP